MRWFRRKPTTRGPYRTAKERAKEREYQVDEILLRTFAEDLRTHPSYARELARRRYGVLPEPEIQTGEIPESPSLIESLRELKEVRDLVKDEFSDKTTSWQIIGEIMKALPSAIQSFQAMQKPSESTTYVLPERPPRVSQQPLPKQVEQPQPPPEPEPEPSGPTTEEDEVVSFVNRVLSMSPEEACAELYKGKDVPDDFRTVIWEYLSGNDIDSLWSQLPMLESLPDFQKYQPIVVKLQTDSVKTWLALLIDEVALVNSGQKQPEIAKNDGENHVETG